MRKRLTRPMLTRGWRSLYRDGLKAVPYERTGLRTRGSPITRRGRPSGPSLCDAVTHAALEDLFQVRPDDVGDRAGAFCVRVRAIRLHQPRIADDVQQDERHERNAVARGQREVRL